MPLCESEHEDSPSIHETLGVNGRCYGDCMEDDDDPISNEYAYCCPPPPSLPKPVAPLAAAPAVATAADFMPSPPHFRDDIIPPPLVALSVEGALPGRHFQVNWFPSGDLTDMDGKEVSCGFFFVGTQGKAHARRTSRKVMAVAFFCIKCS